MNNQNSCQHRREVIAALVLGELEPQAGDKLREHIDACEICRSLYQALTDEEELIRSAVGAMADRSETIQAALIGRLQKESHKPSRRSALTLSAIFNSRITKLAAAAVIIVVVLVGIYRFGISMGSVAWADVEAAFLAQPWVHIKYDNGREQWISLEEGKFFYEHESGRRVFVDRVLNIRQMYAPRSGEHISEDRPAIYPHSVVPQWEPKTAWQIIVGHLEKAARNADRGHWEVEKVVDRIDDKELVRFDRYYNDAVGRRLLRQQVWADPRTRLPVRIWELLGLGERKTQQRESITGEFDFPASGPSSIYDLGVPRDLRVVKEYDGRGQPFFRELLEAGKSALASFPKRYRAIKWPEDGDSEVDLVYRDGEKVHHERFFSLPDEPDYHLGPDKSAEEVLVWGASQPAVDIEIFDGMRSYTKRNAHPAPSFSTHPEPRVRVLWRGGRLSNSSRPHENIWPYLRDSAGRVEGLEQIPQELSGCIGLRLGRGDIRRDFYIDPQHDYICVKWIWWKERSGKWEKEREYECSNFVQLPEGQWYAGKRVLIKYPNLTKGTVGGRVNWNIDFKVLEEDEYPADTFNGEKLLEGAKIETY
jgi:hypothetical protein